MLATIAAVAALLAATLVWLGVSENDGIASSRDTESAASKSGTISDTFDADFVDPAIWHQVTTDGNVTIVQSRGGLEITVGPDAQPGGPYDQIDVHVGKQCRFPGDFDARVAFELIDWPPDDNVFVGLNAIYADAVVGRASPVKAVDRYVTWVVPGGRMTAIGDAKAGALRISRIGSRITTYVWHRDGWFMLATGSASGEAVFGLQALVLHGRPFGHQQASVAFDNFTVTGARPLCPPGSEPPGF